MYTHKWFWELHDRLRKKILQLVSLEIFILGPF